ncbi:maleylpyruvate isomerase N-terminal domain-containing protein [Spirillospora sp. CA-294931]|uniref:maleylpyruvate isomerase N-terminal domain-containing protein n=1 Tax=Spirillospora sp. CA-294931 TaxID=3240042 RepID=UPI003D924C23
MITDTYLATAESALLILDDPAVATNWDHRSALEGFTVGGLAEHLAAQIHLVTGRLETSTDQPPITVDDHYARAPWVNADLDAEANIAIRARSEAEAPEGPESLAQRTRATVEALRTTLPAEPEDRPVWLPWVGWSLTLGDFLITRMLELAVHSDDLAYSVAAETPPLPTQATETVTALLTRLAIKRHGPTAVLRALTRTERAPTTIAAI